jgi:hypothetical protein
MYYTKSVEFETGQDPDPTGSALDPTKSPGFRPPESATLIEATFSEFKHPTKLFYCFYNRQKWSLGFKTKNSTSQLDSKLHLFS